MTSTSAGHRRVPLWKRVLFTTLLVGGLVLPFEMYARHLDENENFRAKLILQLRQKLPSSDPIPARADAFLTSIGWPPGGVSFRMNFEGPSINSPYLVAGVHILDDLLEPKELGLLPETTPGGDKRRVFVIGGSAPYGYPYTYRETLGGRLDQKLFPEGFFVLNAARPGWCSGELVPIVDRLTDSYTMDALVIFCGNNEFIHWYDEELPTENRRTLEAMLAATHSSAFAWLLTRQFQLNRTGSLRRTTIDGFERRRALRGSEQPLSNPAEKYGSYHAANWALTKQRFLDNFEANLSHMVKKARQKDAAVILSTIPFNYRLCPAWNMPQPESFDPRHEKEVRRAIRDTADLKSKGLLEDSIERAREGLLLDDKPPVLHYLVAECLEALGRHEEAELEYAQSRENVIGNFGSMLSINERIRRVAASTGVNLLDARKLFDEACHGAGQFYNEGLILDDCHPTPRGHEILAEGVASILRGMAKPAGR